MTDLGIPSELNSPRTYTHRSSPLSSPFGSNESFQKDGDNLLSSQSIWKSTKEWTREVFLRCDNLCCSAKSGCSHQILLVVRFIHCHPEAQIVCMAIQRGWE